MHPSDQAVNGAKLNQSVKAVNHQMDRLNTAIDSLDQQVKKLVNRVVAGAAQQKPKAKPEEHHSEEERPKTKKRKGKKVNAEENKKKKKKTEVEESEPPLDYFECFVCQKTFKKEQKFLRHLGQHGPGPM